MDIDETKPIPKAVWITEPAGETWEVKYKRANDERAQWAPSFEAIGLPDTVKVQNTLRGIASSVTGNEMFTLEEMFRHCKNCIDQGWQWWPDTTRTQAAEVVDDVVKRAPALSAADKAAKQAEREKLNLIRQARQALVAEAGAVWRKAVVDRNLAMAQWDQYVANTHAAFTRAKSEV